MTTCYNCKFARWKYGDCISPERLTSSKDAKTIKKKDVSGEYDCRFFKLNK